MDQPKQHTDDAILIVISFKDQDATGGEDQARFSPPFEFFVFSDVYVLVKSSLFSPRGQGGGKVQPLTLLYTILA